MAALQYKKARPENDLSYVGDWSPSTTDSKLVEFVEDCAKAAGHTLQNHTTPFFFKQRTRMKINQSERELLLESAQLYCFQGIPSGLGQFMPDHGISIVHSQQPNAKEASVPGVADAST